MRSTKSYRILDEHNLKPGKLSITTKTIKALKKTGHKELNTIIKIAMSAILKEGKLKKSGLQKGYKEVL